MKLNKKVLNLCIMKVLATCDGDHSRADGLGEALRILGVEDAAGALHSHLEGSVVKN
jgi:hypothetical protein